MQPVESSGMARRTSSPFAFPQLPTTSNGSSDALPSAIAQDPVIQRLFLKYIRTKKSKKMRSWQQQQQQQQRRTAEAVASSAESDNIRPGTSSPTAADVDHENHRLPLTFHVHSASANSNSSRLEPVFSPAEPREGGACDPPTVKCPVPIALVERHVQQTIARLDAGFDYELTELNEAIVRQRIEKADLHDAPLGTVSRPQDVTSLRSKFAAPDLLSVRHLFPLEHIELLQSSTDPLYQNPQPAAGGSGGVVVRCDSDSSYAADRRSSLSSSAGHHSAIYETDSELVRIRTCVSDDGIVLGTDDELGRPPSVNAVGGIRPYRPSMPPTNNDGDAPMACPQLTSCSGTAAPRFPGRGFFLAAPDEADRRRQGCLLLQWLLGSESALVKAIRLWRCSCRDHWRYAVVIPFAVAALMLVIFRYAGLRALCTQDCSCSTKAVATYLPSFGLVAVALPTTAFTVYMVHIAAYAQHRAMLENGAPIVGGGGVAIDTRGARMMMQLHRTFTIVDPLSRHSDSYSMTPPPNPTTTGRTDAEAAQATTPPQPPRKGMLWDVPSLWFVAQQKSFIVGCVATVCATILGMSSGRWGVDPVSAVLIELGSIVLPLIMLSFYLGVPRLVWTVCLLVSPPYAAYLAQSRLPIPRPANYFAWPFIVYAFEKVYFYVLRTASLPSMPVGFRIAFTTLLSFTAQVVVMGAAVQLDPREDSRVLLGVVMQIFLYEMLFATLTLDRLWMFIRWQYITRVLRRKVSEAEGQPLSATDLRCVSIQTRWASMQLSWAAVGLILIFHQWPRRVSGGVDCDGVIRVPLYPESYAACIAAHIVATLLTMLVRYRNDCLRPPLTSRELGFCVVLGLYAMSTVPMGLGGADRWGGRPSQPEPSGRG